jgi:CheY-like chemotaxis protein
MTTATNQAPILVVDDDVDVREALADTLEYRGFAVVTATNGHDALRVLRSMSAPPAFILLDLMMPVMDGYTFLEEQRSDPDLASIPVAVVTAGFGVDRRRVGRTPVLKKPLDVSELLTAVQQVHVGTTA